MSPLLSNAMTMLARIAADKFISGDEMVLFCEILIERLIAS